MNTARRFLRYLLPVAATVFLVTCSSNDVVDSSMVSESYSDYREGKKKALNNLITYYRDPSLPKEVRKEALMKIIESNDPVGIQAIRNSLKEGEDLDYELFNIGVQALSRTQDVENIRTILLAMESSRKGYIQVRDEMFQIVEDQVDARSIALILKMYAEAKTDYAAFLKNLTLTLGRLDDERVVPILMQIAKNPKIDIGTRNLAVEILASKNDPAIATMLAEMLENPQTQRQVESFAISVMDEYKDERLVIALIEALHNEQATYHAMVDAITQALGDFDDPKLKGAMLKVAQDDTLPSRYRRRAIQSLVKFEDAQIAESLIEILDNPDNYIFYKDIKQLVETLEDYSLEQKLQETARKTQAAWEAEG